MKRTIAVSLAVLALALSAYAIDKQSCYKPSSETTVCEFSPSGRVNITSSYADGTYYSTWFTRAEFQHFKTTESGRIVLRIPRKSNPKSEAQAQSWHTQEYCEADGFIWRDDGCHATK